MNKNEDTSEEESSNKSGMAAVINNINSPDDMEENPREVRQVGRTCSNPTCPKCFNRPTLQICRSSVQSRNDSPEVEEEVLQGMAAGINNINLPDDMEENPREVLQVGRTCSNPTCPKFSNRPTLQIRRSSVQSRNDSPEVVTLDDEDRQVNKNKKKCLPGSLISAVLMRLEKRYDELITKLETKESKLEALQLRNEKLLSRLQNKEELNSNLRETKLQFEGAEERLKKAEELGEQNKELKKMNVELEKENTQLLQNCEQNNREYKGGTSELQTFKEYTNLSTYKAKVWERESEAQIESISSYIRKHLECYFCFEIVTDVVVVECGHLFCKTCLEQRLQNRRKRTRCPLCRSKIKTSQRCIMITEFLENVREQVPPAKRGRYMLTENTSETSEDDSTSEDDGEKADDAEDEDDGEVEDDGESENGGEDEDDGERADNGEDDGERADDGEDEGERADDGEDESERADDGEDEDDVSSVLSTSTSTQLEVKPTANYNTNRNTTRQTEMSPAAGTSSQLEASPRASTSSEPGDYYFVRRVLLPSDLNHSYTARRPVDFIDLSDDDQVSMIV